MKKTTKAILLGISITAFALGVGLAVIGLNALVGFGATALLLIVASIILLALITRPLIK
jgi:hypothetical protein